MLERSAGLDGKYAPTWQALAIRYYYDSQYSSGGEESFQRSNAACERALALDPNLILVAAQLITNRVERGELKKAYEQAQSLLKRHPESAQAHFTLAYVDRYAGMLEEASRECDTTLRLDPGNFLFRSCAWAFLYRGDTAKAREFVALDAGSEWANWVIAEVLLREGKQDEAREAARKMPTAARYKRDLMEAALGLRPALELDRIAQEALTANTSGVDPEWLYQQGALLAFAGKKEAAIHAIRTAIEQNYCALSALENDPLLSKLRPTAEFADLLKAAKSCQQPVMAKAGQAQ
jgi:tetratricopeptide (TPR) repeat protein